LLIYEKKTSFWVGLLIIATVASKTNIVDGSVVQYGILITVHTILRVNSRLVFGPLHGLVTRTAPSDIGYASKRVIEFLTNSLIICWCITSTVMVWCCPASTDWNGRRPATSTFIVMTTKPTPVTVHSKWELGLRGKVLSSVLFDQRASGRSTESIQTGAENRTTVCHWLAGKSLFHCQSVLGFLRAF
jgi:hypothetical protein